MLPGVLKSRTLHDEVLASKSRPACASPRQVLRLKPPMMQSFIRQVCPTQPKPKEDLRIRAAVLIPAGFEPRQNLRRNWLSISGLDLQAP